MKAKLFGALLSVTLLAAAPAGAATLAGTSDDNFVGSIGVGDAALSFDASGANGIGAGMYDATKIYYDYVFSFSLTGPAKVSIQASGSGAGGSFTDFHAVLYNQSPLGSDLNSFVGDTHAGFPDNQNYDGIDITDGSGFVTGSSTSLGGDNVGFSLASLGTNTYYLRLFGVLQDGATLAALGGSFAVSAVVVTPVPAALPLFLSAIGGLGFLAHRRRKAAFAA